jgi:hypothetical protein
VRDETDCQSGEIAPTLGKKIPKDAFEMLCVRSDSMTNPGTMKAP